MQAVRAFYYFSQSIPKYFISQSILFILGRTRHGRILGEGFTFLFIFFFVIMAEMTNLHDPDDPVGGYLLLQ